jgi:hypothetical protein
MVLQRRIDFRSGKKAIATTSERLNAMDNANVGFEGVLQQGEVVAAEVTHIHNGGVSVKVLPVGVAGIVKLNSFGETKEVRDAVLAKVKIGQKMTVKVDSYQPGMQQYVLTKVSTPRKPMKHLLPAGTMILVDSANVLSAVHKVLPQMAPIDILRSVEQGLLDAGHEAKFFMEVDTHWWAMHLSPETVEAFNAFCAEKVGVVHGEADELLLQMALAMPNAVILSNDRFRDYAEAYPEIVGTPRVLRLNVIGNAYAMMGISGLKGLIPVQSFEVEEEEKVLPPEIACIEERYSASVTSRAVCSQNRLCQLRRKAAARDPEALECLATRYAEGDGVVRNFRKSATLDRCAQEAKKRIWQQARRQKRGVNHFRKCA